MEGLLSSSPGGAEGGCPDHRLLAAALHPSRSAGEADAPVGAPEGTSLPDDGPDPLSAQRPGQAARLVAVHDPELADRLRLPEDLERLPLEDEVLEVAPDELVVPDLLDERGLR